MNLNFLGATAAWVTAATAVACLTACTGGALAAPLHPNAVGERGMAEVIIGDVKAAV